MNIYHKSKIINRIMGTITPESIVNDLRYLQLLSRSFPTIADASTEIINLEAILNLPLADGRKESELWYSALQQLLPWHYFCFGAFLRKTFYPKKSKCLLL